MEPHVIDLAQKLAVEGFVAAVPDLFHGQVATEPDDGERAVMMVFSNIERAIKEIIGALDTVKAMPNVEPKRLGLVGFCMGGFLAYTMASRYSDLGAVVPFYGAGYEPTLEDIARVNAPVLALYGGEDDSVPPQQIEKIKGLYQAAGKDYTVHVYNAGHAFINPDHDGFNKEAASQAWPMMIQFLKEKL